MAAFLGRALFAVVALVLVTQNVLLWRSSSKGSEPTIPLPTAGRKPAYAPGGQTSHAADNQRWSFEPLKHSENVALNRQQCDVAFPSLWYEIDRSVSFWKHDLSRLITANDTSLEWQEQGVFRALIHRN
jgi:hypothetical protein